MLRSILFAANTDLGKTLLGTGLARAAAAAAAARDRPRRVLYLKPVQTGYPADSDTAFVQRYTGTGQAVDAVTLIAYRDPLGPHLAAQEENRVYSDAHVLSACESAMGPQYGTVIVETAGGVLSPAVSGTLQADLYRPWRLPVVLVGDGRLGGIATTLAAYEALLLRGYDVDTVLLLEDTRLRNEEAIRRHVNSSTPVVAVPRPPDRSAAGTSEQDTAQLARWYASERVSGLFADAFATIQGKHAQRARELDDMAVRARETIWWPFTQHGAVGVAAGKGVTAIDSAYGDTLTTAASAQLVDAAGSWWTNGMGHGNPAMAKAAAYAAGRYGHVMFPQNIHAPAMELADRALAQLGSSWASRVFFSDDGSTATEIALKMAFRRRAQLLGLEHEPQQQPPQRQPRFKVLALLDSYHGDTLGAMLVSNPNVFNQRDNWYSDDRGVWLRYPSVQASGGKVNVHWSDGTLRETYGTMAELFDDARLDSQLAQQYLATIRSVLKHEEEVEAAPSSSSSSSIGALVIEPVVQGANGMIFVDPLFQRVLVREAKRRAIPVVFDEVFVGCYRLGSATAAALLKETPDIACYAKLLTGGLVPMALTLATEDVFGAFKSPSKLDALLHGHSFTAHPVGCASAVLALKTYEANSQRQPIQQYWDEAAVRSLSSRYPDMVAYAWTLGTVLAVKIRAPPGDNSYATNAAAGVIERLVASGVYIRPLGDVIYMMVPPTAPSSPALAASLLDKLCAALELGGGSSASASASGVTQVIV